MKKLGTIFLTLLVSTLLVGVFVPMINKGSGGKVADGFDKWLNGNLDTDKPSTPSQDNPSVTVEEQGINVQHLKNSKTTEGYEVRTFSYAVKEKYSTDSSITASLTYVDGTDCSDIMTMEIDETKKEISLTCKGAFSKQILLSLVSKSNPEAKALIKVDYVKRLLTFKQRSSDIRFGGDEKTNNVNELTYHSLLNATYSSVYSKDKDYSFIGTFGYQLGGDQYQGFQYEGLAEHDFIKNIDEQKRIGDAFAKMIISSLNTGHQLNKDDIWNLDSSALWHSFLKDVSEQNYGIKGGQKYQYDGNFYVKLSGKVECIEDPNNKSIDSFYCGIYYTLNYDYSDQVVDEIKDIEF